jgi:phage tail-like protein
MYQERVTGNRIIQPLIPKPEPSREINDLKKESANMPSTQRKDPYSKYNFVIEIEGITQAGFMECTGLESKTEIIRYREGSDSLNTPRLLPGLHTFSNITLKRGITDSKELAVWRKTVTDGQIVRKSGAIVLRDNKHQEVARWNFREAWPCRMSGPQLNALDNEVAIEEIEICHEGIDRA